MCLLLFVHLPFFNQVVCLSLSVKISFYILDNCSFLDVPLENVCVQSLACPLIFLM